VGGGEGGVWKDVREGVRGRKREEEREREREREREVRWCERSKVRGERER
jgi:hypothetical protein